MFDRKINTQTDSQLLPFPTHTQVEGAEVTVYRIRDPVLGDAHQASGKEAMGNRQ